MTPSFARKVLLVLAASASLLVAFGDDAHAQTREHVLLARQVGLITEPTADPTAGGDADCWDWTNEDGTHGTNCPGPSRPNSREIEIASFSWG